MNSETETILIESITRIETNIVNMRKNSDEMKAQLSSIDKNVIIQSEKLKSAHKRIDVVENVAEDYKKVKNRGLGVIFGLSAASGGIGAYIGGLFKS